MCTLKLIEKSSTAELFDKKFSEEESRFLRAALSILDDDLRFESKPLTLEQLIWNP